jgi:DNA-binding transcriptional ArsR family regulator
MRPTTPDLARAYDALPPSLPRHKPLIKPVPVYTALDNTRLVWAALTSDPQITTRRLAKRLCLAYTTVARHIRILKEAGYVEEDGRRARRVIVPMYSALPRVGGRGLEVYR